MPTITRPPRAFDRSSIPAYIGAGAAIAFIAAMTIGAIDAPSNHGQWVAEAPNGDVTHMVAREPSNGEPQVR